MCGICGLLNEDGRPVDAGVLEAMNDQLVHRGPDSEGHLIDGSVGLAMRRLSIIDLDGGQQPIANESGEISVIQNGEIYNYRELAERLRASGHEFSTHSDTEVLVHLYEEHGLDFATHLRGMFAVAIWDAPRRRLVLARDPFGIKPLYWRHVGGTLSFASELKSLVCQPGFSRAVDPDALEAYLQLMWVPGPRTIYSEARKLLPGHLLVAEDGEVNITRYARPAPAARDDLRRESEDELAEELRDRLRDSVRAHLVADVPVGVLLSGGVDSSALAALASEESGDRVQTFSIGFEEASFSELEKARAVARKYDTDHHELVVRPDAIDLLPKLVDAFDEPFADSSALPTYLVSELTAGHVKVALAGEGGDELFGGYNAYSADMLAPKVGWAAAAARPLIERLPSSSRALPFDDMAKRFARSARLPELERHLAWQQVFSADMRDQFMEPARRGSLNPIDFYRARYAETEGADPLARLQDLDLGIDLVDRQLVKTDRASMAVSLETRVPLLDPAVAELAFALPAKHKVRTLSKKRLLRKAVEPLLPQEVIEGRKQGFGIPAASWLRNELQPFMRDVLSEENVRRQGYFRPEAVRRLMDDHTERRTNNSRHLWTLLVFGLWADRAGAGAADSLAAADAG